MKRFWIASALVAGLIVPGARAVSARQEHAAPTVAYMVHRGDTLWSIVRGMNLNGDPRQAVDHLMRINSMRSPELFPGQTLRIPLR